MRVPFRQGIVSAPSNFLTPQGSSVDLTIPQPGMVTFTIADGQANYLISERFTVNGAWSGPFNSGVDYWLYWDINIRTGARTFGHTVREPAQGSTPPANPSNDQHWFDTTANVMKVWSSVANQWVKRLRLFAARLQSGSVPISVSINAPSYVGTQVGSLTNAPVSAGSLVFDVNGDPVKRTNGTFFTTEDVVVTGISSSSQIKLNGIVTEAVADENIPAYSIVYFTDFHQIRLATNSLLEIGAYGIIEVDAPTGTIVNVVSSGVISNPLWDWSALGVNTPLFVSEDGTLTPNEPANPVPVANVIDQNTIVIRPSIQTIAYGTTAPLAVLEVQNSGVPVETEVTLLNFVGATVTNPVSGTATVTIPTPTPFNLTVEDEGTLVQTAVNNIDVIGGTVTTTGAGNATITIPTPTPFNLVLEEEGVSVQSSVNTINFVGGNVTATPGVAGEAVVTVTPEPTVVTYVMSQDLLLSHRNAIVRFDSATPVNYTVPTNATVPMPVGATVVVSQNGAGAVTIVPVDGSVAIVSPETLTTRKQYGKVTLTQTAINYWEVEGNLQPV